LFKNVGRQVAYNGRGFVELGNWPTVRSELKLNL